MKRKAYAKRVPVALPSDEQINAAFKVLHDQAMHWYQLLLFNGLTSPGGEPVVVERGYWTHGNIQEPQSVIMIYPSPNNQNIMDKIPGVIHPDARTHQAKELAKKIGFHVCHDDTDETVLAKVEKMLDGAGGPVMQYACCSLASPRPCVCVASFSCPIHGDSCVGGHD